MDDSLIRQLNTLNQEFYHTTAESFSDSRSYYWQGWNKLVPYIQELANDRQRISVLDIGSGNGRFGLFIKDQLPAESIQYTAVDSSPDLLQIAEQTYEPLRLQPTFIKLDIVTALLNNTFTKKLNDHSAHMVLLLGVLHHIPSHELRKKLIQRLAEVTIKSGYVAITTWNFMESDKLKKKIVDPKIVKIDPEQLEAGDTILDWQRGQTAYRYCHYTDEEERRQLIEAAEEVGLKIVSQFTADGKTGKLNTYLIFQKDV